ncbi:hypothetical protein PoB_005345200 [Plakobranchus ocellatus]|uniref:Uncharacterized protein n=1 Tax=Plakobranchus ocellatus TaxID=259542 RepID=A0AAV4C6E7_9GAST|nr:hypothetical protein PoB_005345200 [Plakobranchus ocellatus]
MASSDVDPVTSKSGGGEDRDEEAASTAVPPAVEAVITAMNAKWEERFNRVVELLSSSSSDHTGKRLHAALSEGEVSSPNSPAGPSKRTKITAFASEEEWGGQCDERDRQTVDLGDVELDDEEELLCSGGAQEKNSCELEAKAFLAEIEQEYAQDECFDAPIREDLAKVMQGRFTNKLSQDMLKKRVDTHLQPENCQKLVAPWVNPEIWHQMPIHARKSDLGLAQLQRCVVKAASAITYTLNDLLTNTERDGASVAMKRNYSDAIALLGHATADITSRRRAAIRPHLNRALHRLRFTGHFSQAPFLVPDRGKGPGRGKYEWLQRQDRGQKRRRGLGTFVHSYKQ